jgi:hypothetical protein
VGSFRQKWFFAGIGVSPEFGVRGEMVTVLTPIHRYIYST